MIAAADSDVIMLLADVEVGHLIAKRPITVMLQGGFNADFSLRVGTSTTLQGAILQSGPVIFACNKG